VRGRHGDRAGDQRQFEVALPERSRRHVDSKLNASWLRWRFCFQRSTGLVASGSRARRRIVAATSALEFDFLVSLPMDVDENAGVRE
jgi:hypothetical protein